MAYTEYYTPTDVFFGKETELETGKILAKFNAHKVLVHYGSGSVIKNGLLEKIENTLKQQNIEFVELGGVKPNPRLSLVRQGIELGKKEKVDFVLAVGGGSVLDSAKAISYGLCYDGDVWDFYCSKAKPQAIAKLGVVLTLSATGSEMSDSSVITNDEITPNDKYGCNSPLCRPLFAIMNPEYTYTVSKYQTGSGSVDIIMHTLERFFHNGPAFELTDIFAADLIKTVISNTNIALEKPECYEARANLMWASSVSHNGLTEVGYTSHGDWACHRLEHELSALYDVAHGAGLSSIWSSWARYVASVDYSRFARLGELVFGYSTKNSTVRDVCFKTIDSMEAVFSGFGMPVTLKQLGLSLTDKDLMTLASKASLNGAKTLGNFKILKTEDMYNIYKAANV